MGLPVLQIFGCGKSGIKTPYDATVTEFTPDGMFYADSMPVVAPLTDAQAGTLYPHEDVFEARMLYFEDAAKHVNMFAGNIQSRKIAGSATNSLDFREYNISHDAIVKQPVYALTSGYLFYLSGGQSNPLLLGNTEVLPGEMMLIIKPFPGTYDSWHGSHPGTKPLPEQIVYKDIELLPDNGSSELSLKQLVEIGTNRKYYEEVYDEYKDGPLPSGDDWSAEYVKLFKEGTGIPILVRGGSQIGWTKPVSATDLSQKLIMFYSFDGNWNSDDETIVKSFFTYFKRRSYLSGHPLITRMLNQSVRAGTLDVMKPISTARNRSKDTLITEFYSILQVTDATHPPRFHPLALDPDEYPHRLIVPRLPPDPDQTNVTLREDQKFVLLRVSNPYKLPITLEGPIPFQLTIIQVESTETEQIFQFKLTGDVPTGVGETRVNFMVTESDGTKSMAFQLDLAYLNFETIPIRFYKLFNLNYVTDIDEAKMLKVIAAANEILGRQTNVYLYPIKENDLPLLQPFYFTDGDLGNPIIENPLDINATGAEDIWDAMSQSSIRENLKVVFVWDHEADGGALGDTFRPLLGLYKEWAITLIDTQPQGDFDGSENYLGKILVHELGHWLSMTCILWQRGYAACTSGHQHFSHTNCPSGDFKLQGNIMSPLEKNIWITKNQADVYNSYAHEVKI